MTDNLVQQLRARSQANGGMFPDAMVDAAADRIEELMKYKSLHAGCDKASLDIEQKLVNQLSVAHKRIKTLETALREIAAPSKIMAKGEDMETALNVMLSSHRNTALAALAGEKKE